MAVTVGKLAQALRIQTDATADVAEPHKTILTDLLAWAEAEVSASAPRAPEVHSDQAIIVMCGYVYDSPSARRGESYANAWSNSGASTILRRYVQRRAVVLDGEAPAGSTGGPGVDQVARDGVAQNRIDIDAADAAITTNTRDIARNKAAIGQGGGVTREQLTEAVRMEAEARATADDNIETALDTVAKRTTAIEANGWVTEARLADDAVTGRKIAAKTIGGGLIGDNTILARSIREQSLGSREIADGGVNTSELAASSVTKEKLSKKVQDEIDAGGGGVAALSVALGDSDLTNSDGLAAAPVFPAFKNNEWVTTVVRFAGEGSGYSEDTGMQAVPPGSYKIETAVRYLLVRNIRDIQGALWDLRTRVMNATDNVEMHSQTTLGRGATPHGQAIEHDIDFSFAPSKSIQIHVELGVRRKPVGGATQGSVTVTGGVFELDGTESTADLAARVAALEARQAGAGPKRYSMNLTMPAFSGFGPDNFFVAKVTAGIPDGLLAAGMAGKIVRGWIRQRAADWDGLRGFTANKGIGQPIIRNNGSAPSDGDTSGAPYADMYFERLDGRGRYIVLGTFAPAYNLLVAIRWKSDGIEFALGGDSTAYGWESTDVTLEFEE